jgi:hypothetical protein
MARYAPLPGSPAPRYPRGAGAEATAGGTAGEGEREKTCFAPPTSRHQHQHQSDARADAVEPELESRADALTAAPADVPLERRELVDTCRDRNRAGGERPVRPVQRIEARAGG